MNLPLKDEGRDKEKLLEFLPTFSHVWVFFFFFNVCDFFLRVFVCVRSLHRGQKRVLGSLKLELQTVECWELNAGPVEESLVL